MDVYFVQGLRKADLTLGSNYVIVATFVHYSYIPGRLPPPQSITPFSSGLVVTLYSMQGIFDAIPHLQYKLPDTTYANNEIATDPNEKMFGSFCTCPIACYFQSFHNEK